MKKISEMTLEELQDYATGLQTDLANKEQELTDERAKTVDLQALNVDLQKRNRDLFLKVEQQSSLPDRQDDTQSEPTAQPTCEEVAKTLKGVIK